MASPNARRFDEALTALRARRAALDAVPMDNDAESDAAIDALFFAERRVMQIPADSISDFRAKFELLFNDGSTTTDPESLAPLFADLHRLTAHEPCRTLTPESWLAHFEACGGGWIEREGEILLLFPDRGKSEYSQWLLETRGLRHGAIELIRQRSAANPFDVKWEPGA